MLGIPTTDRVAIRREAAKGQIIEAAWDIGRADGLAAITLRGIAQRVGMKAPSLYEYFDSKHAIYDALFAQGYRDFQERLGGFVVPDDRVTAIRAGLESYFDFCSEDAARYQLMFQRTIPGFEPSAESYALALEVLDLTKRFLVEIGIDDDEALDALTALNNGLAAQQAANEPGGTRWRRLTGRFAVMFVEEFASDGERGEER